MSRDKQIEEMAKYLETIFPTNGIVGGLPIKIKHDYRAYAKLIYTAGYRKASEVAREIIEEAEKIFMFTCSSLEAYTDWQNFKKKYTEEWK